MTLSFSQQWPKSDKPNHFVEKVWEAILQKGIQVNAIEFSTLGRKVLPKNYKVGTHLPKLHTIRVDSKDRWKVGAKIHPVINNRTKNRLQFAPEFEVQGIQKIKIEYDPKNPVYPNVNVMISTPGNGGYKILGKNSIDKLAANDGFESVEQFFSWFNKDFLGKIIHWTELKY